MVLTLVIGSLYGHKNARVANYFRKWIITERKFITIYLYRLILVGKEEITAFKLVVQVDNPSENNIIHIDNPSKNNIIHVDDETEYKIIQKDASA